MPNGEVDFNLGGLRRELRRSRSKTISSATITVTFKSPQNFSHDWTLEDISNMDELDDEIDGTVDAAKNRIKQGWIQGNNRTEEEFDQVWNEIQPTLDIEVPDSVTEFINAKEDIPDLEAAVDRTEEVYDRTTPGRRRGIGRRMNQQSENLSDYRANIEKVDDNLDFEDNVEGGDVFLEDRVRTTGDLTWYNKQGEQRFFLITSVGATVQTSRGGRLVKEFSDKEEAWEYYKENRMA